MESDPFPTELLMHEVHGPVRSRISSGALQSWTAGIGALLEFIESSRRLASLPPAMLSPQGLTQLSIQVSDLMAVRDGAQGV
jgi:hypothetical protein